MTARVYTPSGTSRLNIIIYAAGSIALFAVMVAWALFLSTLSIPILGQKNFVWLIVLAFSALTAGASWVLTGGRSSARPIAQLMVRLGIAMEIMALIITPIGLFYETNPVVSVPIGYASFLTMFFGVFIAGFGGNMLAPPRA